MKMHHAGNMKTMDVQKTSPAALFFFAYPKRTAQGISIMHANIMIGVQITPRITSMAGAPLTSGSNGCSWSRSAACSTQAFGISASYILINFKFAEV